MDHLQARGVYIDNPAGFEPRAPWLMSVANQAPVRPAPAVGEADGVSVWEPRESEPRTQSAVAPLAGVRVVDFTAFWAGPAAAHSLAALGADVIKIESIQRPDGIRYSGGMRTDVDDWWEYGWVFHAMNTNKRSVTLDLQSTDGIELVKDLVRQADVVIENFSPRVMDLFGLGADTLLELNPRVVVVRMPAFGLTGPWRDRVGFAPTMEQIAGLAWVTGLPDGLPVAPRGACDPLAGAHAAFATLTALEFAERTGRGQLVEVPMIETVLNVTAVQTMEFEVSEGHEAAGQPWDSAALQDVYRCAGDDDWIAVSVRTDEELSALAELVGGQGVDVEEWLATQDVDDAVESYGSRDPGGCGHLAVIGDREPAVGAPRLLRAPRASEDRHRPVSVPSVRPSRRWAEVAASHAADAGSAQRRGADGIVWTDPRRSAAAGRRRRDRHQAQGHLTPSRNRHLGAQNLALFSPKCRFRRQLAPLQ